MRKTLCDSTFSIYIFNCVCLLCMKILFFLHRRKLGLFCFRETMTHVIWRNCKQPGCGCRVEMSLILFLGSQSAGDCWPKRSQKPSGVVPLFFHATVTFHPLSIITVWLIPDSTSWWLRHMVVNNLPTVIIHFRVVSRSFVGFERLPMVAG